MPVVACAHKIDIAITIYLSAREKENIDATLACAIEQFTRPVGEKIVFPALQQRYIWAASPAFACEQRCGCRNWRGIPNGHMTDVPDLPDRKSVVRERV